MQDLRWTSRHVPAGIREPHEPQKYRKMTLQNIQQLDILNVPPIGSLLPLSPYSALPMP